MDKLRYREFTWPRNPAVYHQSYERKAIYDKDETDRDIFVGLSGVHHIITGSGVFTGETAYADFKSLAALCEQTQAGPLVHPIWGTVSAFLTGLSMEQESRENYVAYSFTFQAADENGCIPK